jgi:hypothetical protein
VDEYEKPVYNLKTSLDKNRVVYGEKVNFTLESKFFEGTPVNGMKFNYYINGLSSGSGSGVLETDENALRHWTLQLPAIPKAGILNQPISAFQMPILRKPMSMAPNGSPSSQEIP